MTAAELAALMLDGKHRHIDDLVGTDEHAQMKTLETAITTAVGLLRIGASGHVRELMADVWSLIEHKITPVAVGPVKVLSIAVVGPIVRLLFPMTWVQMVEQDAVMQAGALIFVGSQAVDYYNGRMLTDGSHLRRASAYEAEYLLRTAKRIRRWKPNQYQRELLAEYPSGITAGYLYARKPVLPTRKS